MTDSNHIESGITGGEPQMPLVGTDYNTSTTTAGQGKISAASTADLGFDTLPFGKRGRSPFNDDPQLKKSRTSDVLSDTEVDKDQQADGNKGSCHQCKSRRAMGDLIFCKNVVDKKNKHCRKKYCEGCLKKFYKEDVSDPQVRQDWSCPSCRQMCCCAACRRRRESKDQPSSTAESNQAQTSFPQFEGSGLFSSIMRSNEPAGGQPIQFMPNMSAFGGNLQAQALFSPQSGAASSSAGAAGNGGGGGGPPQQSSFAMLYAVAQMPQVRAQIKGILDRKDISDEEKVESIASLLRQAVDSNPPPSEEYPSEEAA